MNTMMMTTTSKQQSKENKAAGEGLRMRKQQGCGMRTRTINNDYEMMRMMRITRKRRMRTMDNKHNDNNDDNDIKIKRKQGRGTRMQDEETTRMWEDNKDNE